MANAQDRLIDADVQLALLDTDGAIPIKSGRVIVKKASACALTLAAPTAGLPSAGGDDGKRLTIVAGTAAAHTITNSSPGFNNGGASKDVATLGGAIGDGLTLIAYNGEWLVVGSVNATLA